MRLGTHHVRPDAGLAAHSASTARHHRTNVIVIDTSSTASTSARSTEHGLRISGRSPDGKFVEIAELPGHPWYLAVQFHPEFKSKPTRPHPLFAAFRRGQPPAQGGTRRGAHGRIGGLRSPGPLTLLNSGRASADVSSGRSTVCRSSRARASSRAPRHCSRSGGPDCARSPGAPVCRSFSRRRSTRPTGRRCDRSAAPA